MKAAKKEAASVTGDKTFAEFVGPWAHQAITRPDSLYLGICVTHTTGSWTRAGLTWRVGDMLIVTGPSVAEWGTSSGLAQLCVENTAKPQYHTVAASIHHMSVAAITLPVLPNSTLGLNESIRQLEALAKKEKLI